MGAKSELLIAVDVGNTNTVLGVYVDDELARDFRLSTDIERTADEYAAMLLPLFEQAGLDPGAATGVIISSVVPPLHSAFDKLSRETFGQPPLFVEPGIKTGLPIRYKNPVEVGADRIVNSLAARERFGAPVIVVDFGTATTFDVVNPAGEYAGGIIAPGLAISAEALFSHASRLYQVEIQKPDQLIGEHTAGAMQSGLFYGYIGLVDGILERLLKEIPEVQRVVATGGEAELIASGSRHIDEVDAGLTLVGLKLIYDRNR